MKKEKWLLEQEDFENTAFSEDDADLHKLIFKTLSTKAKLEVPDRFASKIVLKKMRQEMVWQDVKVYVFYASLFLILVFVGFGFMSFDSSPSGRAMLIKFSSYLSYFVLAALGYFFIQTIDRILVKGRGLV
ncbi:MAG: hypothetical protein ACI9IP_001504 [Arcticibacterium sp.]|jgi:hypothetical protein